MSGWKLQEGVRRFLTILVVAAVYFFAVNTLDWAGIYGFTPFLFIGYIYLLAMILVGGRITLKEDPAPIPSDLDEEFRLLLEKQNNE